MLLKKTLICYNVIVCITNSPLVLTTNHYRFNKFFQLNSISCCLSIYFRFIVSYTTGNMYTRPYQFILECARLYQGQLVWPSQNWFIP